ncbi:MAG: ABC transporter permease subunit [Proteobacteria bacterium]|nr:ABC transporter permease subunit [Pseudomonadota bacterium]
MKTILTIFWKEFRGYFNSPIAYIFIISFLVFTSWLFFKGFFLMNQSSLRSFFSILPWVFLFLAPAVTMRSWAEEKKLGTIELLMTLPVKDYEVVLGKFLASFIFLIVTLLCSIPLPLTVMLVGNPDIGPIWGGYVGAFLMGGAYLAIGCFASSLTENQIVAFILAIFLSFALLIIGENLVIMNLPAALVPVFTFLGLGAHFESIGRGVIDSRDIIYYISIIGFFLFLNGLSVESRKWK